MPKYRNFKSIPDEWLLLALQQAACIHRREEIVQQLVEEALRKLSSASSDQRKRRFAKSRQPKRVYLENIHLLQHLVFYYSEKYERTEETYAPESLGEREMIIRYIAFIVRKILKRNSLYGVTGLCRFICNYEFEDVRKIHEVLLDEPNLYKNVDDFRSNRKMMRDGIFERFSNYVRFKESQNGQEKHFQLRDNQNDPSLLRLVTESLNSFQPWHTQCLPADFKPHEEKQPYFRQHNGSSCEVKRMHALIHPNCFRVLMNALKFDLPDLRLGLPQFFSVKSIDDLPPEKNQKDHSVSCSSAGSCTGHQTSTDSQKLKALRTVLVEQDEKLFRFVPRGILTIKIDDRDVANFNLDLTKCVQFTMDNEEAELIEVVAQNDNLVVAVHLLDDEVWQSQNRKHSYVVRHRSGARITFAFIRLGNVDTGSGRLSVTVTYAETNPSRFFAFLWHRMEGRLLEVKNATANATEFLLPQKLPMPVTRINNTSLSVLATLLMLPVSVVLFLPNLPLAQYVPLASEIVKTEKSVSNNATTNEAEDRIKISGEIDKHARRRGTLRNYHLEMERRLVKAPDNW